MIFKYKHTIFTPIYNRVDQIENVYKSLLESRYNHEWIEWVIIDDGSTDDLKSKIDQWTQSPFEIRYIRKENGGIHTAQNRAIMEAQGEFITRIDSDDIIHPEALDRMDKWIEYLKNDVGGGTFPPDVIGVVGLTLNKKDGTFRCSKLSKDVQITTGIALRKAGASGDRNFCMRTEIMRNYLIPELPGTKWVPEGIIWNRIDRVYKTCFVNDVFSICSEPNEDSMLGSFNSRALKRSKSACMSMYYGALFAINENSDNLDLKQYMRRIVSLWVNILSCGEKKLVDVIKEVRGVHKLVCFLMYAPCFIYINITKMKR